MGFFAILIGIAAVVAYRVTSAEQREHFYLAAREMIGDLKTAAMRPRPELDEFRRALRARMRFPIVTPLLAVIITAVFVRMRFSAATIDSTTLVAWGASLGTRTTNGEWWRLVTSSFVHDGTLHLLVDLVALIQVGLVLERFVGRLTLAAVYLSAGVFCGLVGLPSHPLTVTVATSGAVFGVYGLLLATLVWQTFHGWRTPPAAAEASDENTGQDLVSHHLIIPVISMRRLAVVGGLFVVYSAISGRAHAAEITGLLVGAMYGVVFARRAREKAPRARRVAWAALAATVLAAVGAFGIETVIDVKPELARVIDLERRTTAAYQAEFNELKKGRVTAEAVAQLAEATIVSQLEKADEHLESLKGVPAEHQPAIADAREYVRLRCASWRAQGAAIRRAYAHPPHRPDGADDTAWRLELQARFRSDGLARARAEGAERASREALQRIERFLSEKRT
jgi:membrane associated rhomboid family serine protease